MWSKVRKDHSKLIGTGILTRALSVLRPLSRNSSIELGLGKWNSSANSRIPSRGSTMCTVIFTSFVSSSRFLSASSVAELIFWLRSKRSLFKLYTMRDYSTNQLLFSLGDMSVKNDSNSFFFKGRPVRRCFIDVLGPLVLSIIHSDSLIDFHFILFPRSKQEYLVTQ